MNYLFVASTLALTSILPFQKYDPTPALNDCESASHSLIKLDDGLSLNDCGNFSIDLFLGNRISQSASKTEKFEFYTLLNEKTESYIEKLNLSCFEITHFWTMPIVTLHYSETPIAKIKEELDFLLTDENIICEFAFVTSETYEFSRGGSLQNDNPCRESVIERGVVEPPDDPWIDYRDIIYDNYSPTTYSGLGVNIGVAEGDSFYPYHFNFIGTPITIHSSSMISSAPASPSSHCEQVMSVLTGKYGVAPMANVHLLNGNESPYSGYRYLDYFAGWGMDIVSLSLSSSGTQLDPYFDFVVSNYGITLVVSCSNPLDEYLNQPASAQNVISVCSIEPDGTIASGSNIRTNDVSENFRIAAVGQNRVVNVYGTNKIVSGTSFATPATAGAIALMMEKNPLLKGHPERVMAALSIASDRSKVLHNSNLLVNDILDSSSGNWSWSGVGALDISKSLDVASSVTSSVWSFSPYSTYTMASLYNLQVGQTIRISHAWLRTASENNGVYANYILSDFDLKLCDPQNSICAFTSKTSTNIENVEFVVPVSGNYTIKTSVYSLIGSQYYLAYCVD